MCICETVITDNFQFTQSDASIVGKKLHHCFTGKSRTAKKVCGIWNWFSNRWVYKKKM